MKTRVFANLLWNELAISQKTRRNYSGVFKLYIDPRVGNKQLCKITKNDILNLLAGLPQQTKYQTFMVIRTLFREAKERGLVKNSPIMDLKTPKVIIEPARFLKWEDLRQIDFGFHNKRIQFLALHGLRYGEAAALTKDDIVDGRVLITKSKYGPTKTKSGVRNVPLMSEFVEFPLYQDRIAKALKPYGVTVHSLRKTYAYMLKQSNVHVTTAAKLLGHSNPMVTLKIYTQVLDNEIEQTGEALHAYMKGS